MTSLEKSKLVIQANKQLTKTCIIVTVIFLLFLGKISTLLDISNIYDQSYLQL